MGCLCLILFNRMQDSRLRFLKRGENQLSSRKAQAVKQAAACLFRIQAYFHGIQDISGVRPTSICIVVTPLTSSPLMTAHWIGAAPRYFLAEATHGC